MNNRRLLTPTRYASFIRRYGTYNFPVATGNRRLWLVLVRLRVGKGHVADSIGQLWSRFGGVW